MSNLLIYYGIPIILFLLIIVIISDSVYKNKKCLPPNLDKDFSREEIIVLAYMYAFIKPIYKDYVIILNSLSEEFNKDVDLINYKYNEMVHRGDPHIEFLLSLGIDKSSEKLDYSIRKIIG